MELHFNVNEACEESEWTSGILLGYSALMAGIVHELGRGRGHFDSSVIVLLLWTLVLSLTTCIVKRTRFEILHFNDPAVV